MLKKKKKDTVPDLKALESAVHSILTSQCNKYFYSKKHKQRALETRLRSQRNTSQKRLCMNQVWRDDRHFLAKAVDGWMDGWMSYQAEGTVSAKMWSETA